MPPWPTALRASSLLQKWRGFSTFSQERVPVRCGSEGFVTVEYVQLQQMTSQKGRVPSVRADAIGSLYNVPEHSPSAALVVHLPAYPPSEDTEAQLPPKFLQDWPVASINYRWGTTAGNAAQQEVEPTRFLRWPIPVHDTAFALHWIMENLAPPNNGRRDVYIYGSYLGASLATSLSLTGAHAHTRFGIRGFVVYNGIYNWTMFLPDHRINRAKNPIKTAAAVSPPAPSAHIHALHERLAFLFESPSNLFDPFASPSLLFHNPGLLVPRSFYVSANGISMIDAMASRDGTPTQACKPPRKSHLVFPPRKSTLKIPKILLLHDSPVRDASQSKGGKSARRARTGGGAHTFEAQAGELAGLMRRSIDMIELKERMKWDEEVERLAGESDRRVQVIDVGQERKSTELSDDGQDIIRSWLRSRVST